MPGDEVSYMKGRSLSKNLPEVNKCFIEITGTRYNGSFLLRLNKDVDESIYRTMKEIETADEKSTKDKALPRKGLSSVLKCLTQPIGPKDDPSVNESLKPPPPVAKKSPKKPVVRAPVEQPTKQTVSRKSEPQVGISSEPNLIGGVLDIFKLTLDQLSRTGSGSVKKDLPGLILQHSESSDSSTVSKNERVRIRFPKDALLVVQPPNAVTDTETDEYEISIEVKPKSIAQHSSQTIKLAKDKILIGIEDGEGVMQVNEPPTTRSFHMTIEEDGKGKPLLKVNVIERKNLPDSSKSEDPLESDERFKGRNSSEVSENNQDERASKDLLDSGEMKSGSKGSTSEKNTVTEQLLIQDSREEQVDQRFPKGMFPRFDVLKKRPSDTADSPLETFETLTIQKLKLPEIPAEPTRSRDPIFVGDLCITESDRKERMNSLRSYDEFDPHKKDRTSLITSPATVCFQERNKIPRRLQPEKAEYFLTYGSQSRPIITSPPKNVDQQIKNSPTVQRKNATTCRDPSPPLRPDGYSQSRTAEGRIRWNKPDPQANVRSHWFERAKEEVYQTYSAVKPRKPTCTRQYQLGRKFQEAFTANHSNYVGRCMDCGCSHDCHLLSRTHKTIERDRCNLRFRRSADMMGSDCEELDALVRAPAPPPSEAKHVLHSRPNLGRQDDNTLSVINLALCGPYSKYPNKENVSDDLEKNNNDVIKLSPRSKWTFAKMSEVPKFNSRARNDSAEAKNPDVLSELRKEEIKNRHPMEQICELSPKTKAVDNSQKNKDDKAKRDNARRDFFKREQAANYNEFKKFAALRKGKSDSKGKRTPRPNTAQQFPCSNDEERKGSTFFKTFKGFNNLFGRLFKSKQPPSDTKK